MDQKLLEDFLSLCRHRSFSHAAQERNVTQPAFSSRSGHWRSGSAWSWFDRDGPPRSASRQQGEQFLPVARDIVDRMAEARREFAAGNRSDGIVRLISLPTLSINVLPDLLFRVRQTCDQLPLCGQSLSSKRGRAFLRPDGTSGGPCCSPTGWTSMNRTANSCRTSNPPPSAGNASSPSWGAPLRNAFRAPPPALPFLQQFLLRQPDHPSALRKDALRTPVRL